MYRPWTFLMVLAACGEEQVAPGDDTGAQAVADTGVALARTPGVARSLHLATLPSASVPDTPPSTVPRCTILEPADGATFPAAEAIHFEGEVADDGGDVQSVVWRSDVWGAMVVGTSFDFELPPADHHVTMTATDDHGEHCEASVDIVVE